MITLAIDTSNQTLAVAVTKDSQLLGQIQTTNQKNHSTTLMPAIERLCQDIGLTPPEIDRIAIAAGPGSYTGLRIGVTTAKTLAYTLNKELVGVSSLAAVAANCKNVEGLIVPLFDARRQNVYAGAYAWQDEKLVTVMEDQHISLEQLMQLLKSEKQVYFVGQDVSQFTETIQQSLKQAIINSCSLWDYPSGCMVAMLAEQMPVVQDIQSFLPRYLKRVEAEEKWLETHEAGDTGYVEKI